jgi:hypothetical protein
MVSDSDMGTEEESDNEEMEGGEEHESERMQSSAGMETSEEGSHGEDMGAAAEEAPSAGKSKAKTGGRRAALRILRENVDSVSKDLASFRKTHEVNSKRLDKQVSSLRNEVASLKSFISKENARSKAKQEALLNRVISKLNEKKPKAAASGAKAKKKPAAKKASGKKK